MIFCWGMSKNVQSLQNLFSLYEKASAQVVRKDKSIVYTSFIYSQCIKRIIIFLGFTQSTSNDINFNYLCIPMFKRKPRRRHLQHIADKIKCMLDTWKGSILSIMGRVQLVNSIIHSMLLYNFMIYSWLIFLIKDIENGPVIVFGLVTL